MAKKTSKKLLDKIEDQIKSNQSKISMVLGALIILVLGVLIYNYFNKNNGTLGPAQQTESEQKQDVAKDKLPGEYIVKDGDTLFIISEKYYADGNKFEEIAKVNNLVNPDQIETGQVLQIPKLISQIAESSPQPSNLNLSEDQNLGTGGGDTTIWGSKIEGTAYIVAEDDWLSKIAGRAYGDILAYEKLAKANNIVNPDHIEPGMVLTIPR